jgi:phosphoserine phosphatase
MGIAYRAKPLVREKAGHSISCLGLDGLLYLIGVRDRDVQLNDGATAGIREENPSSRQKH